MVSRSAAFTVGESLRDSQTFEYQLLELLFANQKRTVAFQP